MISAEFEGINLRVKWSEHPDNQGVLAYRVEYECATDTVLHYVKAESFKLVSDERHYSDVLLYEENRDAGLSRDVSITIYTQAADGSWTAEPEQLLFVEANNPPPPACDFDLTSTINSASLRIIPPTEKQDIAGYLVWVSTVSTFDPETTPPTFDQISDFCSLTLTDDTPTYIIVAAYDVFSKTDLNYSIKKVIQRADIANVIDVEDLVAGPLADAQAALDLAGAAILAEAVNQTLSISAVQTTITGQVQTLGDAQAVIVNQVDTITDDLAAETSARTTAVSTLNDNLATLQTQANTLATDLAAETTARQTAISQVEDSISVIETEQTTQADDLEALTTTVSTQVSQLEDVQANLTSEQTTRANADSALSTSLTNLTTTVNGNYSSIQGELTTLTTDLNTTAISVDSLQSRMGEAESAITSEAMTRANADSSLTTQINTVSAVANSKVKTYYQTGAPTSGMATGDLWFDSNDNFKTYRYSGSAWVAVQDPRIAQNVAAITAEQVARADGDSALASSISSVTTTVSGHTATINQHATSIDGLEAQASLVLNANGKITGYRATASASESTFDILASRFRVIDPNVPSTALVPFEVVGGQVRIKDAVIQNLTVDKLSSGTTSAQINLGTGLITGSSGSAKATFGAGFGASSNLILWSGAPSVATGSATPANSRFYVDTAGNVGLKGSIEGSIIKSSAMELGSTKIHTGGGRLAPYTISETGSHTASTTSSKAITLIDFMSPDWSTGYNHKRFARHKMDVNMEAHVSGDYGDETLYFEARYDGGAWVTILSVTVPCAYRGSIPMFVRYTTLSDWDRVNFRARTTQGNTMCLSFKVEVANYNESGNTAGSNSGLDSSSGSGGTNPPPPAYDETFDPFRVWN